MPTEGPARPTRGPIPVNSPFIPPSLIQAKRFQVTIWCTSNLAYQDKQ